MSEKVAWRLKSQLQEQNLDGAQVAESPRFFLVRDGGLCSYSCGFNRQILLRHPLNPWANVLLPQKKGKL